MVEHKSQLLYGFLCENARFLGADPIIGHAYGHRFLYDFEIRLVIWLDFKDVARMDPCHLLLNIDLREPVVLGREHSDSHHFEPSRMRSWDAINHGFPVGIGLETADIARFVVFVSPALLAALGMDGEGFVCEHSAVTAVSANLFLPW